MSARSNRRGLRALAAVTLALGLASAVALTAPSLAVPPQAAPGAAEAAPAPSPDVVEVTFAGGAAADVAQSLPQTTYGAPTYGNDADQGPTMTVDGVDDAVAFPFEDQWGKLGSGFTVECVFRLEANLPTTSERDLCSDKEAGGFSIYVTGNNLGFMGHIGGGYKSALTPIQSRRWYHAAATWDGTEIRLYVNGQLAQSTPAAGALLPPAATSRRFVVGADASPSGIGQPAPPGTTFAASGVFARALSPADVRARAGAWDTSIAVPDADVFDVDFADGTTAERVNDLAVRTFGDPQVGPDAALHRNVATLDGDDALGYEFDPQWSRLASGFSIECTFRHTGPWPAATEADVCSGKEAGGLSIYLSGDQVGLMAHIGGGYKTARTPISTDRWHHVVATWDGSAIRLYLDGELKTTTPATGALGLPNATARAWTLGADSSPNGGAQFYAAARLANARIYGRALDAGEVAALDVAAFGEYPDAAVDLTSTTPAAGDHLTEAVDLRVDVTHPDNATGWTYLLDGQRIEPGDRVGPGLAAGDHLLEVVAVDVFGKELRWEVPFTSGAIPTGGGTGAEQGTGTVTLSAIATSPDRSDVTTTFRTATATVAGSGVQGELTSLPATLEFDYQGGSTVDGRQTPDDGRSSQSPSSPDIPFQRYDVVAGTAALGQQVVWKGTVDPARAVSMFIWSTTESEWTQVATSRGARDAETLLNGVVRPGMVDGGVVHVLVAGIDPFADDLAPRDESAKADKDRFEDPDDYDFSMAHFTDTQYLAEGATGGTYDDWDGVAEPSDVQLEEERAIWAAAYRGTTEWIRDNAASRKIAYAAHTGDIIENDYYNPLATDATGKLLYPGLDAQVTREFDFTSGAHEPLDSSSVVNQVVAGNHDNQLGNETGPDSRFNEWYGPERYYRAAQAWPDGASYHAWDEVADADGTVTTPGRDNQNNYVLFSAGGLDFVAVGLSYGVTAEEAQWASSVFSRYPDRNGILLTHAYLAPSVAPDGRGARFSGDGSPLFDKVVAANPNVFLVLAGHEHGVGTNLKTGVGATVQHDVVELLADYQFYKVSAGELWPDKVDAAGNIDLNGDGKVDHKRTDLLQFGASWMRLLQFDVDRSEVSIDTYSPKFDNFGATEYDDRGRYNGAEDNLTLPVDLSSRTTSFTTDGLTLVTPTDEVIGEETVRSGWPATVNWSGLEIGEIYAWTAESRTESGERIGRVRQFGSVFRATAAGADRTAPELTVPAESTVTQGDPFDAMAGVRATDDTDGDVTDRIQVSGAVDTARPGTYALTYLVADTNGNQSVVSRAVSVVAPVDDRAASAVTVTNAAATFGQTLTLRAAVTPGDATGSVQFLNGEEVLCEAPLTGGTAECAVRTLPPPGGYVVSAVYGGDDEHRGSQRSFVLTVAQPAGPSEPDSAEKADPRLTAKARKASLRGDRRVVLSARVADGATGRVVFRRGDTVLCRALIRDSKATCTVKRRLAPGRHRIVATYRGSASYEADRVRFTIRVRR